MRGPGIEPGSAAWKAAVITFRPPTLDLCNSDTFLNVWCEK